MRRISVAASCLVALSLLLAPRAANAAGFSFPEQSVRANGMADAYTAIADDPSAVFFNPAGLGFLRGLQAATGVTLINGRVDYDSARTPNDTSNRDRYIPLPYGFASAEVNDLITVGGGIFAPYGLGLGFPKEAETRFNNQYAFIRAQYITAAVGIRPTDWISVGGTVSYVTSRRLFPGMSYEGLRVNRSVDLAEPIFNSLRNNPAFASVPDEALHTQARNLASSVREPQSRLKGDADGFGYSLGVLVKPFDELAIGLTYRGSVLLRDQGNAQLKFAGVEDPVGLPPGTFTNSLIRSRIHTSIELPPSFSFGISSQLADKLTLSFTADWTGWSTLDEINLRITTGRPAALQQLILEWSDVWAFRFGVEYLVIGNYSEIKRNSLKGKADEKAEKADEEATEGGFAVAVRAGYAFDESPIPNKTVSAFLPDNDRHLVTVGLGVDLGWLRFDTSVQFFDFKTIRKDNANEGIDNEFRPTVGKFESIALLYGFGVTLRF